MCDIAGRYLELTEAWLRAEGCARAYYEEVTTPETEEYIKKHFCRVCGEYVYETEEPAFDLTPTGECYAQAVHMHCQFLESNGHAAEEIRAALVTDEIF